MADNHSAINRLLQELEGDLKDMTMLVDEHRSRANELQALGLSNAAAALYGMANSENNFYNQLVQIAQAVRERAVQLEAQQPVAYPEWPAIRWMPNTKTYEAWDHDTKQVYRAKDQAEALALFGRLGVGAAQFNSAFNTPYRWVRIWPRKTAEERGGEFFGMPELS